MRYATAAAFRSALEAQVRLQSQSGGPSIVRVRKAITFERLLARLLVVAPERWMLKGALALDFRLGIHARATMDMDLGRYDDTDAATGDLLAAQERDLGDYVVFGVERTDRLDALREATAVRYHVHAELAGRTFEHVTVDVGFSPPPTGGQPWPMDTIVGPDFLAFAGIAPIRIPTLSLEYHIAEKLHAYTRGYGETGTIQSTRVKDLIDLVVIASTTALSAHRLRSALLEVFEGRRLQALPPHLPPPPTAWRRPYATMAQGVGVETDLVAGYARAAVFLDPILSSEIPMAAVWNQTQQHWRAGQGLSQRRHSPGHAVLGLDPDRSFDDPAVLVDDEVAALDAPKRLSTHGLLGPDSVGLRGSVFVVYQEHKRQGVLCPERLVRRLAVRTDAKDDRVLFLDQGVVVAEAAGLDGTTGRIILGIKIEDHFLAPEVRQSDRCAAVA